MLDVNEGEIFIVINGENNRKNKEIYEEQTYNVSDHTLGFLRKGMETKETR